MSNSQAKDHPVPQGWNKSRLGDICSWLSGGTPSKAISRFWSGRIPWVSPKDMKVFRISDAIDHVSTEAVAAGSRLINEGTVLIVIRGMILAHSFPVAITVRPVAFNQDIKALICGTDVSGDFLAYWLVAKSDHILSIVSESTHGTKRFDLADLRNLRFDAPPPTEQRKIARILTNLDNLIEKTEALIAKYQAIKQGMMHDLFTRGVDEHGHLRPPYEEAPELYKQSELGWIPKDWEVCRVDEAGTVKLGRQRSPKHQSGRFTTPYLRVANVFDGWIDYTDILEMDFTPTERDTFSVLPGDIFLNEGQSLELVGRSAMFLGEPNHFCFQNTLIRFRAFPSNSPTYCRGIFKYWLDVGRFMTVARQTTSVAHLGADRLVKMLFPLPKSDEQTRIASRLQSQERQYESDEKFLANLSKIKTGLMQDLLTGKIRVMVDEAEEVAAHA